MYKAIIFDIDNTLLDFDACEHLAFNQVFKNHGIKVNEDIYDIYHELNEELWLLYEDQQIEYHVIFDTRFPSLFDKMKIDLDPISFEKEYLDLLSRYAPVTPGAKEILEYLKDDYELYIGSNGITAIQEKRLQDSGLFSCFKELFISDAIGYAKPSKEFFDECKKQIGYDSSEILMVGDKLTSDILGGNKADMDTCYFNKHSIYDKNIHPTYEITALLALKEFL